MPYETPGEGHSPYPWDIELSILPWRADSGADWILNHKDGQLLIIPSGLGLTSAYEETKGEVSGGGGFDFNFKDIDAWRKRLDEVLTYTDSNEINTYYAAWSLGGEVDIEIVEAWLRMVDKYVKEGRIIWNGIPDIIDLYNANN